MNSFEDEKILSSLAIFKAVWYYGRGKNYRKELTWNQIYTLLFLYGHFEGRIFKMKHLRMFMNPDRNFCRYYIHMFRRLTYIKKTGSQYYQLTPIAIDYCINLLKLSVKMRDEGIYFTYRG